MHIPKLQQLIARAGEPAFRLDQITKAVFSDAVSSYEEITVISKSLREVLTKELPLLSCTLQQVLKAKDGRSMKALLRMHDGALIETVLIAPKPGAWSACISCQVGCAMHCEF